MKQEREIAVTIYPEEGNFPAIAKALLAVADHPSQVRSVSHPRAGFEVPEDVYDRFEAAQHRDEGQAPDPIATPALPETLKRRPGRPRKNPVPDPVEMVVPLQDPGTSVINNASKEE